MSRFFKTPKPKPFEYVPRFYDPAKEELEERIRRAEARKQGGQAAVKERIREGLRKGSTYNPRYRKMKSDAVLRSNLLLLAIVVVLVLLTYMLLTVYLPRLEGLL